MFEDVDHQIEVLHRMKELWTADANPRATFPEANELLHRMKRSPSLDSRLRDATHACAFAVKPPRVLKNKSSRWPPSSNIFM